MKSEVRTAAAPFTTKFQLSKSIPPTQLQRHLLLPPPPQPLYEPLPLTLVAPTTLGQDSLREAAAN